MPFSPRAMIFLAIILAGAGGAIWWLYDDVVDFAENLGQSQCQSAQYKQTIKDQERQLQKLRNQKRRLAQARDEAKSNVADIREQWRAERRKWRERLQQDPEAREYLRADIPDSVDQRLCALLSCPDGNSPAGDSGGPES